MSRLFRRRDRVKEEIPITTILLRYDYRVHGESYEQQFPCDLHGDGFDGNPSARVYPESNDFYCFACDKTRDTIALVQEKEGVEFAEAIRTLEQWFALPELPGEDGDERPNREVLQNEVDQALEGGKKDFGTERNRVSALLDSITQEGEIPLLQTLAFWEMYDRICCQVDKGGWDEATGGTALEKLRTRVMKRLTEN